jgi:hypothetical protein
MTMLKPDRWNRLKFRESIGNTLDADARAAIDKLYATGVPAIWQAYGKERRRKMGGRDYDAAIARGELEAGAEAAERAQRELKRVLDAWWAYE